jgi:hypothetical protein
LRGNSGRNSGPALWWEEEIRIKIRIKSKSRIERGNLDVKCGPERFLGAGKLDEGA